MTTTKKQGTFFLLDRNHTAQQLSYGVGSVESKEEERGACNDQFDQYDYVSDWKSVRATYRRSKSKAKMAGSGQGGNKVYCMQLTDSASNELHNLWTNAKSDWQYSLHFRA